MDPSHPGSSQFPAVRPATLEDCLRHGGLLNLDNGEAAANR